MNKMNNNIISHKKNKIPTSKLSRNSILANEQYFTERKTPKNIINTSAKKRNNNSKTRISIASNSKPVSAKSKIYSREKSAEISHRPNYKIEVNKKIKISTGKKETEDSELKNLIINAEKNLSDKIDNGINKVNTSINKVNTSINKVNTSINNVGLVLYYSIETLISYLKNDKDNLEESLKNLHQQSLSLIKIENSEKFFELSQSNNDGNIQINKNNLNTYDNSNNNINIVEAGIDSDKKEEKISFDLNKKDQENNINLIGDIIKQQENSNNSSSNNFSIHVFGENNNGKEKKSSENSSDQAVTSQKKNSSSSGQSNSGKERKQKIFKDSLEKVSSSSNSDAKENVSEYGAKKIMSTNNSYTPNQTINIKRKEQNKNLKKK